VQDAVHAHLRRELDTRWDSPPDAITVWLGRAPRIGLADAAASLVAAHCHYLEQEGRGPGPRADAYTRAVEAIVRAVEAGERPTWPGLLAIQTIVLDQPEVVRDGVAHCRDRRYGYWPGMAKRMAAKLAADARDDVDPVLAAVRLYLDLVHVHPFVDGNARAARLGLSWWLASAGLPTPRLDPWVRIPKLPGEPPWDLVGSLARMVAR
jgi:hypothetical protein